LNVIGEINADGHRPQLQRQPLNNQPPTMTGGRLKLGREAFLGAAQGGLRLRRGIVFFDRLTRPLGVHERGV
jgi:hypothetical protein